jgi:glyoxylase-like metal-dependent hydrolase (beta-lactamase superfamily II)
VGEQFVSISDVEITAIVSMPFQENSYIARLPGRNDCLVVDPGLEPEKITQYLDRHSLTPAAILITHGHSDHIGGNHAMKQRWPQARLIASHGDAPKLTDAHLNLSAAFGLPITSPAADELIGEGDRVSAAGFELDVLEIPGHSSGHVVFVWKDHEPPIVFSGDVIFAGSVGRTDFPGGSFDQLAAGIRGKLFTLPGDTVLLTGHGGKTTVERERRTNPFVGEIA